MFFYLLLLSRKRSVKITHFLLLAKLSFFFLRLPLTEEDCLGFTYVALFCFTSKAGAKISQYLK